MPNMTATNGTVPLAELSGIAAEVTEWVRANREQLAPFHRHDSTSMEAGVTAERGLQKKLWDAGWTRYGWPEEVGGLGGDIRHRVAVYEALTSEGLVIPEPFSLIEVLAPVMTKFAPQIAATEVAKFVSGEALWTLGLSEPESGSDLFSLRTRAEVVGDEVVINGHKTWNGMGQLADHTVALCRTGTAESRHRGLTYFFIDLTAPGVTVSPIPAATGRNEFCDIYFDNVRLPLDHRIGAIDGGAAITRYLMWFERGGLACIRQCWLRNRLDDLIRNAELSAADSRVIGELCMQLTALRVGSARTLDRLARGDDLGSETSYDKLLLATVEQAIVDFAARVLSPAIALDDDVFAADWRFDYIYARAVSIYGGANEIHKNIIAESILGLPR